MRPTVGAVGVGSGFDLAIPLATSHLELILPEAHSGDRVRLRLGQSAEKSRPRASWPTWAPPSD